MQGQIIDLGETAGDYLEVLIKGGLINAYFEHLLEFYAVDVL